MALALSTFEFDLLPDSGTLPQGDGMWLQVQHRLLEFMATRDVERRHEPARRGVFAWTTRYNTRRRHSTCGHRDPIAWENAHHPAMQTLAE